MSDRKALLPVLCLLASCAAAGWPARAAADPPAQEPVPARPDTTGAGAASEPPGRPREVRSPAGLEVLRAYVCEGIEESEPAQAGMSFLPGEEGAMSLWCFTEIGVPAGRDTVVHVWRWGDREMARIPLEVRGPRWRTWSVKSVRGDLLGAWSVDVTDRSGFIIMRLRFSVE